MNVDICMHIMLPKPDDRGKSDVQNHHNFETIL